MDIMLDCRLPAQTIINSEDMRSKSVKSRFLG